MERISNHIDEELTFVQSGLLRGVFELRSGDSVAGILTLGNLFGMSAVAETEGGQWKFVRRGFLRKRVSVRSVGTNTEIAHFRETGWTHGGTVQMPDGRRVMVNANFWLTGFEFRLDGDVPLLRYGRSWGFFPRCARLRIFPEASGYDDLAMLVMLGGYVMVMAIRDRAARAG
jgi:hypothetical protein